MKNAQKFVCAGLAVTIVFCVISAVFTFIGLENNFWEYHLRDVEKIINIEYKKNK